MSARRRRRLVVVTLLSSLVAAGVPASAMAAPTQWWHDQYGIRAAWSTTRGEGVRIAIIDSGIGDNSSLNANVVDGEDFSGDGSSGGRTPVSDHPDHGTLVASLAAGTIGSAPDAELISLSIGFDSDRDVAEAVIWAVDHGADVINLSLTRNSLDWPRSWDEAFLHAEQHDVVVVTAAGNRAQGSASVGAPATMPGVLVVAGLTRGGTASWGASSQGITLGVAAPSEGLIAAMPGGGTRGFNGTSGAAPVVAGVVALVRAAHPELDAANVINRILVTADDAGPAGPDLSYGWGVLDAAAAVTAHVDTVDVNPLGTLAEWIHVHRRAEVDNGPLPIPSASDDSLGGTVRPPESAGEPADAGAAAEPDPLVAFRVEALPWLFTVLISLLAIGSVVALLLYFRSARPKG